MSESMVKGEEEGEKQCDHGGEEEGHEAVKMSAEGTDLVPAITVGKVCLHTHPHTHTHTHTHTHAHTHTHTHTHAHTHTHTHTHAHTHAHTHTQNQAGSLEGYSSCRVELVYTPLTTSSSSQLFTIHFSQPGVPPVCLYITPSEMRTPL